jgi:DNA primase
MFSKTLKDSLDIIEVVSRYLPDLKSAGRTYKANCPFHEERTPSFVIFPETQTWRCFGACVEGGDAISFTMKIEKIDFQSALKLLAESVGITVPRYNSNEEENIDLYNINQSAYDFFHSYLLSANGLSARNYIINTRGINQETLLKFGLGLSPKDNRQLPRHLENLGYKSEQIAQSGLVFLREDRIPKDMFANRIVFPIKDAKDKILGFGARTLIDSGPKYINSSKTKIFDKSSTLYGINLAKDNITQTGKAVLVEGYMDVITAHQYGYNNVVACMGTALTEAQVRYISIISKQCILALDSDVAGASATFRSIENSWKAFERVFVGRKKNISIYKTQQKVDLRIAEFSSGKDPDEIIRNDSKIWENHVENSKPLIDYLIENAASRWDISSNEGRQLATENLSSLILSTDNDYDREHYYNNLAKTLSVEISVLKSAIISANKRLDSKNARSFNRDSNYGTIVSTDNSNLLEDHLISMLIKWPNLFFLAENIEESWFSVWENRQVFNALIKFGGSQEMIVENKSQFSDNIHFRIDELGSMNLPDMPSSNRQKAINQCVLKLQERYLRKLKKEEASLWLDKSDSQESSSTDLSHLQEKAIIVNDMLSKVFNKSTEKYNDN